ncbi:hypothetical protein J010_02723 [Cryptococcus neoformans]|nr:hypothetical protein J007_02704 [Cryptococcus neoformans var. grubii]OXH12121.1 hypothetical protein J010_02723 [Cryptococcus neoformans var. grubii]OXH32939.1 hypothetical protein J009_02741 [Cryptococcus neoformans var. grubii]OXH53362.1 hypothetical protein J003_02725 [Cryptococcus neoformans var. grubii]OXH56824.1 hypothetical protein J002_02722 [Cryptococcus neoformans var. grubii]
MSKPTSTPSPAPLPPTAPQAPSSMSSGRSATRCFPSPDKSSRDGKGP